VDFTTVYSGPITTQTLADQGADVIKVEAVAGDLIRRGRPARNMVGAAFAVINRNKRGIVVDPRSEAGLEVVTRLIKSGDVLVENFRPDVMTRLKLSYEDVKALNPRIIYASINGVGATGPYANRRVYDAVIQAISGMASIQADPSEGAPRMLNTLACDKVTSLTAAQSIAAALYAREQTGQGQRIEVSMLDASISFLWPDAMASFSFVGEDVQDAPPLDHSIFVRQTADGYIATMPVKAAEWEGAFRALDMPNLLEDERFDSLTKRFENQPEWQRLVNEGYRRFNTEELCERLEREDVPYSKINSRAQVIDDPQIVAMQALVEYNHPDGGTLRQPRPAARFHGTPSNIVRPSPGLGEHTAEVMNELGFTAQEVERLRARGVIA
jgi:crotonobetainyl-CoA:carnitine CoA-transferase CaiB-like acyl-CoA transferase|tara:strand:- start:1369 stop:2520 length:1152 start_codon:yes stop_codon:yes gene_type:complete